MSIVKVTLTHSISKTVVPEKRYGLTQTIEQIKANLATHFPTPAEYMRLDLKNDKGVTVEVGMQDEKLLGYYQCRDDFIIHVIDLQPAPNAQEFEDVSKVEKFEISEEAYGKREDNLRAFRERMLAQQRAALGDAAPKELCDESYKEAAEAMKVGDRCQVSPGDRLGEVTYVGRVDGLKAGYWIGVRFDEPVGKGDGTVKGRRFFECNPQYGGFLRPEQVTVGDFPAEEF
jgi:tubulin-folding cofactor B